MLEQLASTMSEPSRIRNGWLGSAKAGFHRVNAVAEASLASFAGL